MCARNQRRRRILEHGDAAKRGDETRGFTADVSEKHSSNDCMLQTFGSSYVLQVQMHRHTPIQCTKKLKQTPLLDHVRQCLPQSISTILARVGKNRKTPLLDRYFGCRRFHPKPLFPSLLLSSRLSTSRGKEKDIIHHPVVRVPSASRVQTAGSKEQTLT